MTATMHTPEDGTPPVAPAPSSFSFQFERATVTTPNGGETWVRMTFFTETGRTVLFAPAALAAACADNLREVASTLAIARSLDDERIT